MINFVYDPMGQRIMKKVFNPDNLLTKTTYYARDAQGNLIATYDGVYQPAVNDAATINTFSLSEYLVYRSSRLSVKRPKKYNSTFGLGIMINNDPTLPDLSQYYSPPIVTFNPSISNISGSNYEEEEYQEWEYNPFILGGGVNNYHPMTRARLVRQMSGMTEYEIPNHLGNVLATLKDEIRFNMTCTGSGSTQCCTITRDPIFLSATDYYPFGMPMPGRQYSVAGMKKYRFGFNTQEREDDVYGAGNLSTAEFWEYDTRLGRRWNLDPIDQISISNYAVNGNNPIWASDPYGDKFYMYNFIQDIGCGLSGASSSIGNVFIAMAQGTMMKMNGKNLSYAQSLGFALDFDFSKSTLLAQGPAGALSRVLFPPPINNQKTDWILIYRQIKEAFIGLKIEVIPQPAPLLPIIQFKKDYENPYSTPQLVQPTEQTVKTAVGNPDPNEEDEDDLVKDKDGNPKDDGKEYDQGVKIPKGYKPTKEYGRFQTHGQRAYQKGERVISRDIGNKNPNDKGYSHNTNCVKTTQH